MNSLTKEFTHPMTNNLMEEELKKRLTRSCLIMSVPPIHNDNKVWTWMSILHISGSNDDKLQKHSNGTSHVPYTTDFWFFGFTACQGNYFSFLSRLPHNIWPILGKSSKHLQLSSWGLNYQLLHTLLIAKFTLHCLQKSHSAGWSSRPFCWDFLC